MNLQRAEFAPVDERVALRLARLPEPILVSDSLQDEFGLRPTLGLELEFSVPQPAAIANTGLEVGGLMPETSLVSVGSERGLGQFELASRRPVYVEDLAVLADQFASTLDDFLASLDRRAEVVSCPGGDYLPNGLHIHFGLEDQAGNSAMTYGSSADRESDILMFCIEGMLASLCSLMIAFAPTENCYQRYADPSLEVDLFGPSRICWGKDNRSVALRVVDSGGATRIEHRVGGAAAFACLSKTVSAVLIGAVHGLRTRAYPHLPRCYGIARKHNHLSPLPETLEGAVQLFQPCNEAEW